ncbi:MAG: phosphate ABC transporter permease family protein, partial [Gammaproteobacteria bacterium]|nr:phosphate ABC transporter permease family protein [Gammaproteobacteria bacterium]
MSSYLLIFLVVIAVASALWGTNHARRKRDAAKVKAHSRPIYHGLNAAIWAGIPAFVFLIVWLMGESSVINLLVLASYPGAENLAGPEKNLLISEIRQVASGNIFKEPTPEILAAVDHLKSLQSLATYALVAVVAALATFGAFFGIRVIESRYRARHSVERSVTWFMMFSSLVAILTTGGIVASLVYETAAFFSKVPITEFLFGLRWEPQIAMRADQVAGQGAFGMLPVLFGTFAISALAMAVAIPVGILSAVYLTEYANERFRAFVKPLLEILAGIPTIVYGFFAVLTVAPIVRELGISLGIGAAPNSALAAGGVMGVMLIPFISSLSDDAFAAVPRAIRDGSYA